MRKHYAKDVPQNVPMNYVKLWMDAFDSAYLKAKDAGKSSDEVQQTAFEQATATVNRQLEEERKTGEHEGGHLIVEPDGKKHLPTTSHGALDWGLLGAAYTALFPPEGIQGRHEGATKEEATAKLKDLYEQEAIPWPSETASKRMSRAHLSDPDFRLLRSTDAGICSSAGDALALLAERRANERAIDYQVALSEISCEYPGLAHAVREETLGTRVTPLGGDRCRDVSPATSSRVAEELARMAETRAREKNIHYQLALKEIAGEHSELVRAARLEVLGVIPQGPGF
jgi:hypothetical protein